MTAPQGSGGLEDLYEAAGRRSGEHRTMIVLAVVGLAIALVGGAFFAGYGFVEQAEESAQPQPGITAPGDLRVDANSLAEAALGEKVRSGGQ